MRVGSTGYVMTSDSRNTAPSLPYMEPATTTTISVTECSCIVERDPSFIFSAAR